MSNTPMVGYLIKREVLRTPQVIDAFMHVDRALFVPTKYHNEAYEDYSLPIADGQVMTQPTTAAIMLELLETREGDYVLEIGSGSGWLTTLLSKIVADQGFVYSFEINRVVAEFAKRNIIKTFTDNVSVKTGDARKYWQERAPFNRILADTPLDFEESELIELLAPNGRLVYKNSARDLKLIVKDTGGNISEKTYSGCVYVSLQ